MKFATKEDIEAPIQSVFLMVSDFNGLERAALRRGAEVQRIDGMTANGVGMAWDVSFMMRSKLRNLRITLAEYDPANAMVFQAASAGLNGVMAVDLVAMSRTRTRMALEMELEATTLSARLMLQSLKLARNKLNKRFHLRVADYATELEARYKRNC
ncbi:SRPBCC family protein [Thalassovita taeanensis]|uniref:Polyketide cyclase / dehydrase and lipid transport n=1 Tax=Thalassovita taeanensis TaxID=657014 RepID=A0A1H9CM57_9RHOB|nr:SRPBCC family protein [Thalassovita taeanensis]SEQ02285.1 hypothetical protein SAMN04488092_103312 [Thalassovita taeanensis]